MSTRRSELTRQAARLFAQKGYHGTSIGDLAEAMGVQKGSLYAHIDSKEDLLWQVASDGAAAFHAALDAVPDDAPAVERVRAALRAHLRVVAEQLDVATVFVREWRYLDGRRRELFVDERRRSSRSRRRTGPTRGCVWTPTPTRSPIASPTRCSTACAGTRHREACAPDRQSVRVARHRGADRSGRDGAAPCVRSRDRADGA